MCVWHEDTNLHSHACMRPREQAQAVVVDFKTAASKLLNMTFSCANIAELQSFKSMETLYAGKTACGFSKESSSPAAVFC